MISKLSQNKRLKTKLILKRKSQINVLPNYAMNNDEVVTDQFHDHPNFVDENEENMPMLTPMTNIEQQENINHLDRVLLFQDNNQDIIVLRVQKGDLGKSINQVE